eukprot:6192228-Pleurochrysis_carterae.AAC.1
METCDFCLVHGGFALSLLKVMRIAERAEVALAAGMWAMADDKYCQQAQYIDCALAVTVARAQM